MKVFLCLSVLASSVLAMPAAEAEAEADPQLLALGYHAVVPVVPLCKHTLETTTQEVCRLEPKKVCETKTQTYTKFTGYEKGDCKEIEVCKAPVWRKKRSAEASPDASADAFGYGYVVPVCEKETKEICRPVPTTEEVSKDLEWCYYAPEKVCEDVEVKVPSVKCGEEGEAVETE